ncbi:MAG: hypothetical protein AAB617_01670 [Patescibacteria group bacterium]
MKKRLVICASSSFGNEILEWKEKLRKSGFEVIKFPLKTTGNTASYNKEFSEHYEAISKADVLLALNLEKRGIPGYIGPGVFAEMAFAIGLNIVLNKNIEVYYLNSVPEGALPYSDELKLWQESGWIKLFAE